MKVTTECFGEVDILNSKWYGIRNYHNIYGESVPATIGIITMKDQYGTIKSYIGLGAGLNEKDDIITILDVGVPFHYESFINTRLAAQIKEANEVIENMKLCMDDKYDYDCVAEDVDIYIEKWGVK